MNIIAEWLSSHTLLLLLSAGTFFSFIWLMQFRDRLNMKWYAALMLAIAHTLVGVVCVKVFAFMETGFNPDSIGNMSLFGGVFFMPLLYLAGARLTKRSMAEVCDAFTGCMILTLMCARVNCILTGCCGGKLIPGSEHLRWPTRETEIVFYIVLLFILGKHILQDRTHGTAYPLYMISYGIFRFIVEWFRSANSPLGYIHMGHIWALVSLGIGYSIYSEQVKTKTKAMKRVRRRSKW